jgi:hypothetical protein
VEEYQHPLYILLVLSVETTVTLNLHVIASAVLLHFTSLQIWGCEKSGLFHAFSRHILHRLKIPIHKRSDRKIHITLLSRDTTYRRILNEKELIEGLQNNPDYVVKRVSVFLLNSVYWLFILNLYTKRYLLDTTNEGGRFFLHIHQRYLFLPWKLHLVFIHDHLKLTLGNRFKFYFAVPSGCPLKRTSIAELI